MSISEQKLQTENCWGKTELNFSDLLDLDAKGNLKLCGKAGRYFRNIGLGLEYYPPILKEHPWGDEHPHTLIAYVSFDWGHYTPSRNYYIRTKTLPEALKGKEFPNH